MTRFIVFEGTLFFSFDCRLQLFKTNVQFVRWRNYWLSKINWESRRNSKRRRWPWKTERFWICRRGCRTARYKCMHAVKMTKGNWFKPPRLWQEGLIRRITDYIFLDVESCQSQKSWKHNILLLCRGFLLELVSLTELHRRVGNLLQTSPSVVTRDMASTKLPQ